MKLQQQSHATLKPKLQDHKTEDAVIVCVCVCVGGGMGGWVGVKEGVSCNFNH